MYKKYIVRLSEEERQVCQDIVKRLKGSSEKVRRAQILLKADADGPNWTDARIAEAFHCRVQTIENLRKRLVKRKDRHFKVCFFQANAIFAGLDRVFKESPATRS